VTAQDPSTGPADGGPSGRGEALWTDGDLREDEISLSDLLGVLRRRKLSIGGVTALCLGLAAGATLWMAPGYRAEARILVEEVSSASAMLGRLANLPIDLSSLVGGAPQTAAEMEVMRSRPVVRAVVGPRGTSELVPQEGLSRTALVDDLARQSLWQALLRMLRGEEAPVGGMAVEVDAWDFPEDFDDPVLVEVLGAKRARLSVDRLWDRREEEVPLGADGELAWQEARLRLVPEGTDLEKLAGRRFRLSVQSLQKAVDLFLEDLVVEETGRSSNVLRVTFEDRDPDRVAQTLNGLVRSYLAHNRARFLRRADRSVGFVDEEIDRIHVDLERAERDLKEFGEQAGTIVLPDAATALVEKLVEVDLERARTDLQSRTTADILERIRSGVLSPEGITGLDSSEALTMELLEPLAGLLSQKRVMEEVYEDDWPPLKEVNTRIHERMTNIQSSLENQIWRQERTAQDLASILGTYQKELETLPAAQLELARHSRRVRAFSEIYLFLVGQKEEAQIARTAAVPSVEVIDWAVPPLEPQSPMVPLNLALGLLLGIFLGSGLALLREGIRRPVVSGEQLEKAVGASSLPSIPRDRSGRPGLATTAAEGPAAEAYRALRGAFRHGPLGKVITITSPLAGEGRSTVAAQLACALARAGERVLLVDGDMRSPDLHRWFRGQVGPGLAEVLATGDGSGTRTTDLEDLSLLPAGLAGHHPGDLVARRGAAEALAGLGNGFDRVILDTPAVLMGSEAPTLAAAADGAVLVVRENHTGEKDVAQACLQLRQAGAHIVGAVLVGGLASRR